MPSSPCIAVVGAGVVGTTIAAHLASSGHDVTIVENGPRLDEARRHGLAVRGALAVSARPARIFQSVRELAGQSLDAVFVCTKTWALEGLAPELAHALGPRVAVVGFHNGVDPEETLAASLGRSRVLRGIVNFAGRVLDGGEAAEIRWLSPSNAVGALEGDGGLARDLAALLSASGLPTRSLSTEETRREALWRAILSAALAPVCALTGLTMGEAMALPPLRELATRLAREGLAVAAGLGHDYGPDALEACLCYLEAGGGHRPSMWVDLERGCRTEIEAINGRIVELGDTLGDVDVTANRLVTALVLGREAHLGRRAGETVP